MNIFALDAICAFLPRLRSHIRSSGRPLPRIHVFVLANRPVLPVINEKNLHSLRALPRAPQLSSCALGLGVQIGKAVIGEVE
jgi:hypothetical protein